MSNKERISRREFLTVTAVAAAGATIVACQPQTVVVKETVEVEKEVEKVVKETVEVEKVVKETVVVEKEKEVEKVVKETVEVEKVSSRQAPGLQEMVKAGELPSVEERLPLEVLVAPVEEEIGQYGGTATTLEPAHWAIGIDATHVGATLQTMLRPTPDLKATEPNLIKDWEMSRDAKTLTIHMRKGLKWSDGEPITADEMLWQWEHYYLNEEITPALASQFKPGGEVMDVEKVDEYTFILNFPNPNPTFVMLAMVSTYGFGWVQGHFLPSHYLEQFHIDFNAQAEELAKTEGYDHWYELFANKTDLYVNPERPTYNAYAATSIASDTSVVDRNPFFWQLDPEGNQLPYIDRIITDRLSDAKVYDVKVMAGEPDFAGRATSLENYAAYEDAAEQGNFRILLWNGGKGSEVLYGVNQTYSDPVLRDIFQDVRFRRALSLAINRDEINEIIYFGRAVPRQMTLLPESQYFKEEYAEAYIEYDPEQANALLDEMGLPWDENHELRLRPDGEPLRISWDYYPSETPKGPITELARGYWLEIGFEINVKEVSRQLLETRQETNEEPMGLAHGDKSTDILFPTANWYVPVTGGWVNWGNEWGHWWQTGGEQGEEPPDHIKEILEWWDGFMLSADPELIDKVLNAQAENLWVMGTVGMAPHPLIVRNNLRNVPEYGVWAWDDIWSYPYHPETWFFKQT